jgi:hypothetical protein
MHVLCSYYVVTYFTHLFTMDLRLDTGSVDWCIGPEIQDFRSSQFAASPSPGKVLPPPLFGGANKGGRLPPPLFGGAKKGGRTNALAPL